MNTLETSAPKPADFTCAACGALNRQIAKFCGKCGKWLGNTAAESPAYRLGATIGSNDKFALLLIILAVVIFIVVALIH